MLSAGELREKFSSSRNPAIALHHLICGATSRIEISQRSGLDRASVTRAVAKLIEWRVVEESALTQLRATGRPRVQLRVNPDYWIVGVHIGVHSVAVIRMGIDGTTYERLSVSHDRTVKSVIGAIVPIVERMRAKNTVPPLGLGIAIGGWVDPATQRIVRLPSFNWSDIDLRGILAAATGLPVVLRPMAVAHAQANLLFGHVGRTDTFGHLYIGSIVEYAIAYNGEVWWRDKGTGGLIERLPLILADGSYATVSEAVSDEGLVVYARDRGLLDKDGSFEDILEVAATGGKYQEHFQALLDERADNVGRLVCQLQEVVSVPTVILSASMVRQDNAVSRVQEFVRKYSVSGSATRVIGAGDIISSTSQATGAALISELLEPASGLDSQ